jgi:NO-binding membrane sensor protein with MHYT domain
MSHKLQPCYVNTNGILVLTSIAIGGGAIWCMHFVGMGAMHLSRDGHEIPTSFDVGGTVFSLITACAFVYIGLRISTRDRVFTKEKDELFQMLLADAQSLSLKKAQDKGQLYRMALLKGLAPLAAGGLCTGLGVCVMHYVGMMSMKAEVEVTWDEGIVAASVLIAVVASSAAFWILFRLLALFPRHEGLRIASAVVMAIAVCGMHYTGMQAAQFTVSSSITENIVGGTLSSDAAMSIAIQAAVAVNICLIMLVSAEQRAWILNVQLALRKSRGVMDSLKDRFPELQKMQQYTAFNGFLSGVEANRSQMSQGGRDSVRSEIKSEKSETRPQTQGISTNLFGLGLSGGDTTEKKSPVTVLVAPKYAKIASYATAEINTVTMETNTPALENEQGLEIV